LICIYYVFGAVFYCWIKSQFSEAVINGSFFNIYLTIQPVSHNLHCILLILLLTHNNVKPLPAHVM